LQKFCSGGSIEFLAEPVNQQIAQRAAQIFPAAMEGENDLGSLVIAIVTEMQAFDFSKVSTAVAIVMQSAIYS